MRQSKGKPAAPGTTYRATGPKAPEETRERLILSARALFAQKGYEATTVKDLADHAAVNVSLVSYHFGGKEGLYRSVIENFGKERLAVAQKLLTAPASIEEFRIRLSMFME